MMGSKRGTADARYVTHTSYYQNKDLFDALLVENVPEYRVEVIKSELGDKWLTKHCILDPRVFGVAAARTRLYCIAYHSERVTWREDVVLEEVIDQLTSSVVATAGSFYWDTLPASILTPNQVYWLN